MYTVSDTFLWVGVLDGFTQTVIWVHCIPAADVSHQILWPWPALRLFHGMNETVNVARWDRGPGGGVVLGVARVGFSYKFSMTAKCFSNLEGSRNYKTTVYGPSRLGGAGFAGLQHLRLTVFFKGNLWMLYGGILIVQFEAESIAVE